MIKRILVPLDSTPFTNSALDYACYFAQNLDAEVTGMTILDVPGIEKSVGPVPAGASYYAEEIRKTREKEEFNQIEEILEHFKSKCEKKGVKYRNAAFHGSPDKIIIKSSMFFDLIIMGLCTHYQYDDKDDETCDSLDKILDSCATSILAVPDKFTQLKNIKATLAFDGSLPAARAMHRFASLVAGYTADCEITVLIGTDEVEEAQSLFERAELYLKAHGFSDISTEWTPKNIIEAFDEKYYDEADLFVLGMHSKNLFADFFVGSLSKHLIQKRQKPILLGQ